jgi:nitrogen PTS system EIIA component
MKLSDWMSDEGIGLDTEARTREEALAALADIAVRAGAVASEGRKTLIDALDKRERLASTALEKGSAVPHAYLDLVKREFVALLRTRSPVPFGASGKLGTDLFLLVTGPSRKAAEHLQILASAARLLRGDAFLARLRSAKAPGDVLTAFRESETQVRG